MPASAAARATFTSGTAAPTRSREPVLDRDVAEAPAQANNHALDAAVAHEKIRAEPDHGDGNIRRGVAQEISEVRLVGRRIEHLGGSAHPEPGEVLERRVGLQLAAKLGKARKQPVFEVGPAQGRPRSPSRLGKAFIQSVMVPAPSPTTRSPDCATEATASARLASSSTVITCGWP